MYKHSKEESALNFSYDANYYALLTFFESENAVL